MAKYHISIHGEPVRCSAKIKCRAENTSDEHFEGNLKEARVWAEKKNAESVGGNLPQNSTTVIPANSSVMQLLENPPSVEEETVMRGNDGRYVLLRGYQSFSEKEAYPLGDKLPQPDILKELHNLDKSKFYQEGDCDSLSIALFENNEDIVSVEEIRNEKGDMCHSVARHKNGYYVDSLGVWSQDALKEYWGTIAVTEKGEGELSFVEVSGQDGDTLKPNFKPRKNLQGLVDFLNKDVLPKMP